MFGSTSPHRFLAHWWLCQHVASSANRAVAVNNRLLIDFDFMSESLGLVLVLCTGNSCRSHMAEGFLRASAAGLFAVASAGSQPAGYVHPLAVQVMKEIGIDISKHWSKHLAE